jgi:hypothetical protein
MSKLTSMMDTIISHTKDIFYKDGEIEIPMWYMEDESSDNKHIMFTPFDGDRSKNIAAEVIRKFCKEKDMSRYVMVSETWYVTRSPSIGNDLPTPSECLDRKEAIVVVGGDRNTGERIFKIISIERNGKESTLVDGETFYDADGRFANIFDIQTRH